MKRCMIVILFAVLSVVNLTAGGFTYQLDFTSRFIFRGMDLLYDNKPAFQPSVTYEFGDSGFSLNAFGSFCLSDRSVYKYSDEIDLTLSYAFKTPEKYSLVVGFTHYALYFSRNFTFKGNTTQEFFIELGLPGVFLSPTFAAYYDINHGDGLYMQLSGAHSAKLTEKLNIDLSASLAYNAGKTVGSQRIKGFNDLTVGAAVPIKTGKLTVAPFVNFSIIFLDAINNENEFWFGLSFIF
jgi:hypothetical protein